MNVPAICRGGFHPPFDTVAVTILQRRGYANDLPSQSIGWADAIRPYIGMFFVKNHLTQVGHNYRSLLL
jgi:hypothetical protein